MVNDATLFKSTSGYLTNVPCGYRLADLIQNLHERVFLSAGSIQLGSLNQDLVGGFGADQLEFRYIDVLTQFLFHMSVEIL